MIAARPSPMSTLYIALVILYWLVLYAAPLTAEMTRGSLVYLALVGPVSLFVLMALAGIAWRKRLPPATLLLVAYVVIVCGVAAARGDTPTILSTLLIMATILVVAVHRVRLPPDLLNVLFLASIPLNVIAFAAELGIYSVVPGFSLDEDLPWRISLFPAVPESAFFSGVIIVLNVVRKDLALRPLCLLLATYFLLFSGLRSALAGTLMALFYYYFIHRFWSWRAAMKMVYFVGAIVLMVLMMLTSQLLAVSSALGENPLLNVYLFRAAEGIESEAELAARIYRGWLWAEHMRIAAENPLLGVGTFDFTAAADYAEVEGRESSGSEAFLTGLYARVGLPAVLFLAFIAVSIWKGIKAAQHEQLMIGMLLVVAMLTYGSFIVPYNFMFLVMIPYVFTRRRAPRHAVHALVRATT
jgi:hypothetical protein